MKKSPACERFKESLQFFSGDEEAPTQHPLRSRPVRLPLLMSAVSACSPCHWHYRCWKCKERTLLQLLESDWHNWVTWSELRSISSTSLLMVAPSMEEQRASMSDWRSLGHTSSSTEEMDSSSVCSLGFFTTDPVRFNYKTSFYYFIIIKPYHHLRIEQRTVWHGSSLLRSGWNGVNHPLNWHY